MELALREDWYYTIVKPFLEWVMANQIQTFSDVIGDIGFVVLLPLLFACGVKYLLSKRR